MLEMKFPVSTSPTERMKSALAACLNRLKDKPADFVVSDPEFIQFHINRNYFNQGLGITKLTEIKTAGTTMYQDDTPDRGLWIEVPAYGNKYHTDEYFRDNVKFGRFREDRYSRKFLKPFQLPNYEGAENEMIIDRSGFRITEKSKMETFNFGASNFKSSLPLHPSLVNISPTVGAHFKYDMYAHEKLYNKHGYTTFKANEHISIIDLPDVFQQIEDGIKSKIGY